MHGTYEQDSTRSRADSNVRTMTALVGVAIAIKIALLFVLAFNSRFVMDEFWQLGQSKFLFAGLFDTMWPGKSIGYAVFFKPAYWAGWDSASIMLAGRMQTALLGCATIWMVYACARAIGEEKLRALVIVLALLGFSSFMERVFRTRAEPVAVAFAIGALLVVLRGNADTAKRLVVAGVLAGLAFVTTQKAVYFNGALGLALVGDAWLARSFLGGIRRGALLVAGWTMPIIAYCLVFGGFDVVPILHSLFVTPFVYASDGVANVYGGLRFYVTQTLVRNVLLYAVCFAGMAIALARLTKLDSKTRIALIFSAIVTALVFAHSEPWPYVFVMALPFMVLWSLRAYDLLPRGGAYRRVAITLFALVIAGSAITNVRTLQKDNHAQLELVARAEAQLAPDEGYFDGIGILPGRRESGPLWLDKRRIMRTGEQGKASEAWQALANTPPKVIIWTYRMAQIEPVVGPLIRNRYVQVSRNILVAGQRIEAGRAQRFDVPVAGTYALYAEDGSRIGAPLIIDGKSMRTPVRLAPGPRTIATSPDIAEAWLLPVGSARGGIDSSAHETGLFEGVYD